MYIDLVLVLLSLSSFCDYMVNAKVHTPYHSKHFYDSDDVPYIVTCHMMPIKVDK